ncbi:MAG: AMP-binding protein [Burkholderiaceae bacterium]
MPNPPRLLHDLLTQWQASDATALDGKDGPLSYARMNQLARSTASHLQSAGLASGGRAVIFLPKGGAECWSVFAVSLAGGVLVPINPLLKAQQVAHICADCTPDVMLTTASLLEPVKQAVLALERPPTIVLIEDIASTDSVSEQKASVNEIPNRVSSDLAAILYTSGSTGRPKGVMLTHDNLIAGTRIVRTYLDISSHDRLLSVLPLSFDYGLNQLLTTVEQRAVLVPFSFMFGDQLVSALAKHQITGLAGVPTIWAILTQAAPKLNNTELVHLRYVTNSGGPVPSATVERLRRLLAHTKIYLMYGLTEAFRSTFLDPAQLDNRPTSIGKAIPECEVFVLNKTGQRAAPGESGILVHRGPTVSRGYWRRPEDTARVIRSNPLIHPDEGPDMVCFSGDLVMSDDEGYLYFVGRDDAMIKSSGYRISPAEVEEALMATGLFKQAAVIGLPDAAAGQIVHAVAVAAASGAEPDNESLVAQALKHCATQLPAYMVPRKIELVEDLPVTPNGKVDHKLLRSSRVQDSSEATR